jgi:hypothetical protein
MVCVADDLCGDVRGCAACQVPRLFQASSRSPGTAPAAAAAAPAADGPAAADGVAPMET